MREKYCRSRQNNNNLKFNSGFYGEREYRRQIFNFFLYLSSVNLDSSFILHKFYELENREVDSHSDIKKINNNNNNNTKGWYRTALSREGACVVCCGPKVSRGFPLSGTF